MLRFTLSALDRTFKGLLPTTYIDLVNIIKNNYNNRIVFERAGTIMVEVCCGMYTLNQENFRAVIDQGKVDDHVELYLLFKLGLWQGAPSPTNAKKIIYTDLKCCIKVDSREGTRDSIRDEARRMFREQTVKPIKADELTLYHEYLYNSYDESVLDLTSNFDLFFQLNSLLGVVFMKRHAYSTFRLSELWQSVVYVVPPADFETVVGIDEKGTTASTVISSNAFNPDTFLFYLIHAPSNVSLFDNNEEIFQKDRINVDGIVSYIVQYLALVRSTVSNSTKANRRIALNIFLLFICNLLDLSMSAEEHPKIKEYHQQRPIGDGPLDYFLSANNHGATSATSSSNKRQKLSEHLERAVSTSGKSDEVKPSASLSSSWSLTGDIRDLLFLRTDPTTDIDIPKMKPNDPTLVVNGYNNDSEDEEEISDEVLARELAGMIEAQLSLQDKDQLNNVTAQATAQSFDTLLRDNKRKRGVASQRVKFILSTAQHWLFFVLTKNEGEKLPQLSFVGRYSVNIFPPLNNRSSGGDLSAMDVKRFFKNLYYFVAAY